MLLHGARQDVASRSASRVILSGILINILYPKLTIFFFAFLPQFVRTDAPTALPVRSHVVSRPRVMTWMRRVFAGSFVALSARLVLTER